MAGEVRSVWQGTTLASGREEELAALLREYEEAKVGERARFVFVRGPRGVGKSHLFGLLRQALVPRGALLIEAQSPRDGRRPFGLFDTVLAELLDLVSHSGVTAEKVASLGRALSPLLGTPHDTRVLEDKRLSLYDACCELFTLAGRSHPVFLFPDLDAADRASLELLRYVAAVATAPESRAGGLYVASLRDDGELSEPLEQLLGRVTARTLAMGGLDPEGIRAYLSRADVALRLFEATGGNPEALGQVLAQPVVQAGEFFLKRVARVSPAQRSLLSLLCAAPFPLSLEVLSGALARRGQSASVTADLDALVREHLLTVHVAAGVPGYRFVRDVEREAYVEKEPPAELARSRAALGAQLLFAGQVVHAAELLLQVDPAGEGAAVALTAADRLSSQGAHEDALELYQRALAGVPPGERARVHQRMSQVYAAQGDFRSAIAQLLRARRAEPRTAESTARYAQTTAGLLLRLGRLDLAEPVLQLALAVPETAGAAVVQLAELQLLRGQPDAALASARQAPDGLSVDQAIALRNVVGKAYLLKCEPARAGETFEQNHREATEAGLPQLAALAMLNMGVAAYKAGDRDKAVRCYQASTLGHKPAAAQALANLGSLYADSGDFDLALDHLSRALNAFSRFGGGREVAHVASNLARLHHFLGDLERAAELSEHSLLISREMGEAYLAAGALLNLGAVRLDQRETAKAQRLFDDARARYEEVGNEGYAALACALKARAHLCAGERAQAQAELSRRVVEQGCAQLAAAMIETELARADLSLALGDLHGAGRAAARARDALLHKPDLEGPFRVYFVSSRLKQAAGDVAAAQADLARANRLLDELTQRVPPARRTAFLSIPRRAEVLAAVEPELRLPRLAAPVVLRGEAMYGLVGRAPALAKIARQLEPVGRSNTTVLIRGESGTGKELVAEAIHNLSPRRGMPLVKVNCAAMVEELLLSELFGHEKGAFTGAVRERKGRFELADGGTLFLDEIGDISPKAQVALLRVLQEHELERVGGTRTIRVDVRVICATNRDLESLIAQGRFRQDLYYRLKGVMLELPPLRERLSDLGLLCAHFLSRIARDRGEPVKQLSHEALELLGRHVWPGNVRELENVLSSAAIFAEGAVIGPETFSHVAELASLWSGAPAPEARAPDKLLGAVEPTPARAPAPTAASACASPEDDDADEEDGGDGGGCVPIDFYSLARTHGLSLKDLRRQVEMQCIRNALLEAGGNISESARLLRMKRSRLSQIVNSEPELKELTHGE